MDNPETPPRPWRDIARELAHEPNRAKALELSLELNQAMAAQKPNQSGSPAHDDGVETGL
jgi:hypothetical protein